MNWTHCFLKFGDNLLAGKYYGTGDPTTGQQAF